MKKTRMQILMDPQAKKMLEQEAKSRSISVGQVIREAVELYGKEKIGDEKEFSKTDPLWDIVGIVSEKQNDLSEEHDHYLYDVPKREYRKK